MLQCNTLMQKVDFLATDRVEFCKILLTFSFYLLFRYLSPVNKSRGVKIKFKNICGNWKAEIILFSTLFLDVMNNVNWHLSNTFGLSRAQIYQQQKIQYSSFEGNNLKLLKGVFWIIKHWIDACIWIVLPPLILAPFTPTTLTSNLPTRESSCAILNHYFFHNFF